VLISLKYIKIFKGTPTCLKKILKFLNNAVTLVRYRYTPWRWSLKIETCRCTFKYFNVF